MAEVQQAAQLSRKISGTRTVHHRFRRPVWIQIGHADAGARAVIRLLVIMLAIYMAPFAARAAEHEKDEWRYAPGHFEVGGFIGGGVALQKEPQNGTLFPVFPRIGYVFAERDKTLPGSFEVVLEPGYMRVWQLKPLNVYSLSAFIKYNFKTGTRLTPFAEFGAGVSDASRDLPYYQGSRFNFMLQLGVGLQYEVTKRNSISAEFRYNHISNAYIYEHDPGFNSGLFLLGYSFHFD